MKWGEMPSLPLEPAVSRPLPARPAGRPPLAVPLLLLALCVPAVARPDGLFVTNAGQAGPGVRLLARDEGVTLRLLDGEIHAQVADERGRASVALRFGEGAAPAVPRGVGPLPTAVRLVRPAGTFEAEAFAAALYEDAWPGVDLRVLLRDGRLAYDLVAEAGASTDGCVLEVVGARALRLRDDGALEIGTPAGALVQRPPVSWALTDAGRLPVRSRFEPLGRARYRFVVEGRPEGAPLVVDPGLVSGSYLGGAVWDRLEAMAVDELGAAYVAGYTTSADFPVTPGAYDTTLTGLADLFVAKLAPNARELEYCTFVGGDDQTPLFTEELEGLALGDDGSVTVCGWTTTGSFPTTGGAAQPAAAGGIEGWVARFDPDGALAWSTFLGGSGDDFPRAVAVDAAGAAYVTGQAGFTRTPDFPTTPGAYDTTFNSIFFTADAFVVKLAPDGTAFEYATYLGGQFQDQGLALAVAPDGEVLVAGETGSADFPATPGAFDEDFNGAGPSDADVFVVRLGANGAALPWATFYGGALDETPRALALDAAADVVVAGLTVSDDLPTSPGAFDALLDGPEDGFCAVLSGDGAALLAASYLGGSGGDALCAATLDGQGAIVVAGETDSADLPVTDGSVPAGGVDAFVARLDAALATLSFGSRLGGAADDLAHAVAADGFGALWLGGESFSSDLPVLEPAFETLYSGAGDAFVARYALTPYVNLGFGLAGTGGVQPLLEGTGTLVAGTPGSLVLSDALPLSTAFLFLGAAPLEAPFKGGTLVPAPLIPAIGLPVLADGTFVLPFASWPAGLPSGFDIYYQEWIQDPGGPKGFSATNALRATTP